MKKQQKLSPVKYIAAKCHDLPFYESLINEDWKEGGMATIIISRKMPSGKLIVGLFMVDTFCLGLKNTTYKFGLDEYEYRQFIDEISERIGIIVECDVVQAHNIIYGAIDYAEDIGFKPHNEFKITEFILDSDLIDDGIDEIEFGKDGKPYYFAGPYDNVRQIMGILERTVGKDNFEFTVSQDNL